VTEHKSSHRSNDCFCWRRRSLHDGLICAICLTVLELQTYRY